MANQKVYGKYNFIVFKGRNGYIVYNKRKKFEHGHTHLYSLKSCKDAIEFVARRTVPHRATSVYFITSLQRLSDDKYYIEELEEFKQNLISSNKNNKCSNM